MPTEQLVALFVEASIKQSGYGVSAKVYNRLYDELKGISAILRSRGDGARRMLAPLLDHKNAQVQLNAVYELLAVEPAKARAVLEQLAQWAPGPQRLRAGMSLLRLDRGEYEPT